MLSRVNKIAIMIILGAFTIVELMFIPIGYKWGIEQFYALVVSIFK